MKRIFLVVLMVLVCSAPALAERVRVYDKTGSLVESYGVYPNHRGGVRIYDNKTYDYVDVYSTPQYGETDVYDRPMVIPDPGALFDRAPADPYKW